MSSMETANITIDRLKKMFSEGKRFDGRSQFDYRDIEVSYNISNKAEGSAKTKIGNTEVIVGIKLAVGEPYSDSPNKGNLICSGDLLPLASPRFEQGPPRFRAIELPRVIDRAIRESGMINFEKLCIEPGEKVWTIFLDIYPINDDGNLIDAASIAAVAALKSAKIPKLDESRKINYEEKTEESLITSNDTYPFSFTFFKLGKSIIMDPTREEEEACEARITFGISNWNKKKMINSCQKGGNVQFSGEEIKKIIEILPKKFDEINEKLKKYL